MLQPPAYLCSLRRTPIFSSFVSHLGGKGWRAGGDGDDRLQGGKDVCCYIKLKPPWSVCYRGLEAELMLEGLSPKSSSQAGAGANHTLTITIHSVTVLLDPIMSVILLVLLSIVYNCQYYYNSNLILVALGSNYRINSAQSGHILL